MTNLFTKNIKLRNNLIKELKIKYKNSHQLNKIDIISQVINNTNLIRFTCENHNNNPLIIRIRLLTNVMTMDGVIHKAVRLVSRIKG